MAVTAKVDVKCGFRCNNMCRFCVQGSKRQKYTDFSTERILHTLELARSDSESVVLTGGEPTTREDFLRLVRRASELGFSHIQIQTNGRMFASDGFCEDTVAAGANDFSLALHGHAKVLHDYLTRVPGSFHETARGIRNLKRLGQHVGSNTVITRSNYRHLPAIARLLVHLGVDQFQFAFVHALGTAAENFARIVPRYILVEPHAKKGLDVGIRHGVRVMTEAIPYCFMEGYTDYVAEKVIPRTRIYDVSVVDDYTHYRVTEGKTKNVQCEECRFVDICEGPWKEYPEAYGWSEFRPLPRQKRREKP
ncbi:MAG: radical SAM protein [Verrucomicrobia bacterium]|jgi:MoaA/NifB/PqqE/SkfB family radical SAM enzyme|nr:radical SAM protein [Verrucomicrobiota bacterium]